jgi:lysophospholipase L1-like esterase
MKSFTRTFSAFAELLLLASNITTVCEAQTPPVRIMPLGDSITMGFSNDSLVQGGYRNRLYDILTTAGYNVDFVGTQTDSNNSSLPDYNHQGMGGYRIDQIDSGLSGWLRVIEDPDVLLLMIGTNDFWQNFNISTVQTRLTKLITDIATIRPFAKIIVSNLPLRTDSATLEALQSSFNAAIPGIVSNQVALGRQVSFLDIHSAMLRSDLSSDGVHPSLAGYTKIADVWSSAVTRVITPMGTTNPPQIARTEPSVDLQHVTVTFSKPLADAAANPANFSLNGGLAIYQAVLDPVSKRSITLTTSTQAAGKLYTLSVSGVSDRMPQQNLIAAGTSVAFSSIVQSNGSFELNFAGWTASGNIGIESAAPYAATDGTKLIAFNGGNLPANGVLSQSFATTTGQTYTLAFDAGVLAYNKNSQTMLVTVLGTRSLLSQQITINGLSGGTNLWLPASFTFVADSAVTTMIFTDQSASTASLDLTLDNVRVTARVPRTLTVASTPLNGVSAKLTPTDLNGSSGGPTGFSRQYLNGTTVTLSAPSTSGTISFIEWQRNGVDFTTSSSVSVTMDTDCTMNAVYGSVTQILVNGSFESDFTGWTASGNMSIASTTPYAATDSTKLVAFNSGNLPANGLLSQSFATVIGQTYTLTFDAGVLAYNRKSQTVQVTVAGSGSLLSQTITIIGLGGGTNLWLPQSFTFVANSSTSTLTFRDKSTSTNSLDLLLDNVRITGALR